MSLWSFRFVLWYICIMFVQPQNRFAFLWPLRIANVAFMVAAGLHILSCLEKGRLIIRFGPATILALLLLGFGLLSHYTGALQGTTAWNTSIDIIVKNALLLILLEAMMTSVRRVLVVQMAMLFSTLWWIKGGIRLAQAGATYAGDRLMGAAVSLIENPNGFAYMLCIFLPLYLYVYQHAPKTWMRYAFLISVILALYIILKTGSRTGIIILVSMLPFLLVKYARHHWKGILILLVGFLVIFPMTGEQNLQRFKTIPQSVSAFFTGKENIDPHEMNQDQQSSYERRMKNKGTWELIKDYPLFGVGVSAESNRFPKNYPYASGHVHCEILMAGRQMGFIGMALYAGFLIVLSFGGYKAWKMGNRMKWPSVADLGWVFMLQALAIVVGGSFSPYAWNPPMMILSASGSALWMLMKQEKISVYNSALRNQR